MSCCIMLAWCAPEMRQTAYVSMVAADVLAPNRRQAIDSHHADSTMNGVSHESWYISHIYVAVFRQCWWDVGRSVTRWLFVIAGSPFHSDNTLCTLLYFTLNVNQTPFYYYNLSGKLLTSQIAKFMRPTWGPSGSCRPQMGPMLVLCSLFLEGDGQGSMTYRNVRLWISYLPAVSNHGKSTINKLFMLTRKKIPEPCI